MTNAHSTVAPSSQDRSDAKIQRLRVSIAGFDLSIACEDENFQLAVAGPSERFLIDPNASAPPDAVIAAGWGEPHDFNVPDGLPELFSSGGTWRLYGDAERRIYHISSPVFGERPYRAAHFTADYRRARILYNPNTLVPNPSRYPIEYPVDELLISNLLARGGGVELHACGLADADGKGYLFVGQSGDGKTTTSRLWLTQPNVRILSDDRIVIRRAGDGFAMHGTPWHGEAELSEPLSAPLTKIFILRKGEKDEIRSLRRSVATALLFARCFPPFHDPAGVDFTLAFLDELVATVPCEELFFVPKLSVVEFIRRQSVSEA
jgi:hypothetical protein